jgi:hypothetical protein
MQALLEQIFPWAVQSVQAAPPVPQAVLVVPAWQTPISKQPVEQLVPPQLAPTVVHPSKFAPDPRLRAQAPLEQIK